MTTVEAGHEDSRPLKFPVVHELIADLAQQLPASSLKRVLLTAYGDGLIHRQAVADWSCIAGLEAA